VAVKKLLSCRCSQWVYWITSKSLITLLESKSHFSCMCLFTDQLIQKHKTVAAAKNRQDVTKLLKNERGGLVLCHFLFCQSAAQMESQKKFEKAAHHKANTSLISS